MSNLTIAVDAGHGEPWNGARTTSGVKEQDLTKDMAEHLKKVLESKGAKVILTRPGTENVDMDQRKAAALEGPLQPRGRVPSTATCPSVRFRSISWKVSWRWM